MYYLHRSTCNPSGMEGNVHFACSKIVLRKWSENRSGKRFKAFFPSGTERNERFPSF